MKPERHRHELSVVFARVIAMVGTMSLAGCASMAEGTLDGDGSDAAPPSDTQDVAIATDTPIVRDARMLDTIQCNGMPCMGYCYTYVGGADAGMPRPQPSEAGSGAQCISLPAECEPRSCTSWPCSPAPGCESWQNMACPSMFGSLMVSGRYLSCLTGGRFPEGFAPDAVPCHDDALGAFFASMATVEHAAVSAFEHLARELATHGAPVALIDQARSFMIDEVQHANAMATLARSRGAHVQFTDTAPMSIRAVLDIAIENAVEGCVRESWGALLAQVQATEAAQRDVRDTMHTIASDETNHAAFSWQLHTWLLQQLSAGDQARVHNAMNAAITTLAVEATQAVPTSWQHDAGLPSSDRASALFAALDRELWSAARALA